MEEKVENISSSHIYYLIFPVQFGLGVLSFQKELVKTFGDLSWLSVVISGGIVLVWIFLIFSLLRNCSGTSQSLYDLQRNHFGKIIGSIMNAIWIFYFLWLGYTVLRGYIEVVQVWLFPELQTWFIGIIFVLVALYGVLSGFRIIVGVSFLSFVFPLGLAIVLTVLPIEYFHYENLFSPAPVKWENFIPSLKEMTVSYLGFEFMLIYLPFIKERKKAKKWAIASQLSSMIIYSVILVASILFFNKDQMAQNIWPTLSMLKILQIPIVERMEHVFLFFWILIIVPTIMLSFWSAAKGIEKVCKNTLKANVLFFCLLIMGFIWMLLGLTDHISITDNLNTLTLFALILIFPYIFFLFLFVKIKELKK